VVVAGRQKSIAFFIALGAGLICVIILLYVGWVLLNWRHGILLVSGAMLMAAIVSGVVLNTIFLVRKIRRNAPAAYRSPSRPPCRTSTLAARHGS
jgi:hypothetical protein